MQSPDSDDLPVVPTAPLPMITPESEAFWRGGEKGRLLIARCRSCGFYIHPPAPICPVCLSFEIGREPVSGRASLVSFTVNYQAWAPGMETPYVIAIVELAEQQDLRLVTNIVETPISHITIGMPLKVGFIKRADVWLPVFHEAANS